MKLALAQTTTVPPLLTSKTLHPLLFHRGHLSLLLPLGLEPDELPPLVNVLLVLQEPVLQRIGQQHHPPLHLLKVLPPSLTPSIEPGDLPREDRHQTPYLLLRSRIPRQDRLPQENVLVPQQEDTFLNRRNCLPRLLLPRLHPHLHPKRLDVLRREQEEIRRALVIRETHLITLVQDLLTPPPRLEELEA